MTEDECDMDHDKIEKTVEDVVDVFRQRELNYREFVFTMHHLHNGVNDLFMEEMDNSSNSGGSDE